MLLRFFFFFLSFSTNSFIGHDYCRSQGCISSINLFLLYNVIRDQIMRRSWSLLGCFCFGKKISMMLRFLYRRTLHTYLPIRIGIENMVSLLFFMFSNQCRLSSAPTYLFRLSIIQNPPGRILSYIVPKLTKSKHRCCVSLMLHVIMTFRSGLSLPKYFLAWFQVVAIPMRRSSHVVDLDCHPS